MAAPAPPAPLEGIHHVTAITGDAVANVRFYTEVLGLRLVKRTVNQDDPTVYHLFYGDDLGSPGADLTFFEYPGAPRGRAGGGMVDRVRWRVASAASLDWWSERLRGLGVTTDSGSANVVFSDPEGLQHELVQDVSTDEPRSAAFPGIPAEHRLRGFDGVRAVSTDVGLTQGFLEGTLGFTATAPGAWVARGAARGSEYEVIGGDVRRLAGAGTVHHVAWATPPEWHDAWRARVEAAGARPTPVIDRFYFRSIYFREPGGVLFEIATTGPGFTVDEPVESLGQALSLPPNYEHLREALRGRLTELPKVWAPADAG
ncbi:MAG: VOC family protein [Candidatus Dormibacteria bacterium]